MPDRVGPLGQPLASGGGAMGASAVAHILAATLHATSAARRATTDNLLWFAAQIKAHELRSKGKAELNSSVSVVVALSSSSMQLRRRC